MASKSIFWSMVELTNASVFKNSFRVWSAYCCNKLSIFSMIFNLSFWSFSSWLCSSFWVFWVCSYFFFNFVSFAFKDLFLLLTVWTLTAFDFWIQSNNFETLFYKFSSFLNAKLQADDILSQHWFCSESCFWTNFEKYCSCSPSTLSFWSLALLAEVLLGDMFLSFY